MARHKKLVLFYMGIYDELLFLAFFMTNEIFNQNEALAMTHDKKLFYMGTYSELLFYIFVAICKNFNQEEA